ncbi:MAG: CHAT domain-containing tetratricopeptide repeat protein, partial [Syntrophaceae bacterium]|nr:CHAT domain-containing tetratricopeptide repeat protein [Syntrophaceae bacterium]
MIPISKHNVFKIIVISCSLFISVILPGSDSDAQTLKQGMAIFEKAEQLQTDASSVREMQKVLNMYEQALNIFDRVTGSDSIKAITLNNMGNVYLAWSQYQKALEYYGKSLALKEKINDLKGQAASLNNMGVVCSEIGEHYKSVQYLERSLAITRKIGDEKVEAASLTNMGAFYLAFGLYANALDCFEKHLAVARKFRDYKAEVGGLSNIGNVHFSRGQYKLAKQHYDSALGLAVKLRDVRQQGINLYNLGAVYHITGQFQKAVDTYYESLLLKKRVNDLSGELDVLESLGQTYTQMGQPDEALTFLKEALEIGKRTGAPVDRTKDLMANLYMDRGELEKAEPLLNKTGYDHCRARFYFLKADYVKARKQYEDMLTVSKLQHKTNDIFTALVGLGKINEVQKEYAQSAELYQNAISILEENRSGITTSDGKNFFEVRINGIPRTEPARGLIRVRMKMEDPEGSILPGEHLKARAFSDHLSNFQTSIPNGLPKSIMDEEQSLSDQLVALKKELTKTDGLVSQEKHKNLTRLATEANSNLNAFVEKLSREYPAYAAAKYPKPVSLKDSALRPGEHAVIFDITDEGVAVRLCADKAIRKSLYLDIRREDLQRDVSLFLEPIRKLQHDQFNIKLARSLYDSLLKEVLSDVPEGAPLIIIPDGILATLPFESLVIEGAPEWKIGPSGYRYPEGLTYLGDKHPLSYYQSLTALTLTRTVGTKNPNSRTMLVIADPVFSLDDPRSQQISRKKNEDNDGKYNLELMRAVEEGVHGNFKMNRLAQTQTLADSLRQTYGSDCLSLTGFNANKTDFITTIAPKLESFGNVVFATHGLISSRIPGLMEPFLALTMAPPGTDGFLRMSDVLSLRMNADVVALVACQTGLGKDVSGEGVMSMGRAFQYAGAKSVLMSLWEVEEKSA